MAFTPRLTSDGMQGNPWWYSNGNVFYASGYGLPNCTCYAYGRYAEIRNGFAPLPTRNAGQWYDLATRFTRGQTPRLGGIMCFNPNPSSKEVGHVAVVEQINSDGSVVTSNSAYGGKYFWTETLSPSNGYLSPWMQRFNYYYAGCIYNDVDTSTISTYVIAAICGCWYEESQLNPGVWESLKVKDWHYVYGTDGKNMGGFGLGQWTNTDGDPNGRLWQLHSWVTSNGYADGDGIGQIEFMIHENVWTASYSRMGFNNLTEFLSSTSTNLDGLTRDFLNCWERGKDNKLAKRQANARKYYAYLQQHWNDDTSQYSWISKNNWFTESETLNNLMCIYFKLIGTPTPPSPSPSPSPIGSYGWGPIRDVLRRLIIHA